MGFFLVEGEAVHLQLLPGAVNGVAFRLEPTTPVVGGTMRAGALLK